MKLSEDQKDTLGIVAGSLFFVLVITGFSFCAAMFHEGRTQEDYQKDLKIFRRRMQEYSQRNLSYNKSLLENQVFGQIIRNRDEYKIQFKESIGSELEKHLISKPEKSRRRLLYPQY